MITMYQIGVTMGFCIAFWVGYGTLNLDGGMAWRQSTYGCPNDSWGDYVDWTVADSGELRSCHREPNMDVQMEYTGIVQDVNFDKRICPKTFTTLLKKGTENNRRRTMLGITAHTFTQLTGMNALLFYLPHILESAGFQAIDSALIGNGIGGTVNFLASIPVYFFVDRWDRRRILTIGATCMAVCMFAISAVLGVYHGKEDPSIINTFNQESLITNTGATGPVGWLYPAEIYPQLLRANAMGVTTSSSYLFNVFVTLISPGRSLEEINLLFSGALLDQRPGAHHPATAAEALLHLEQIRYRDKRERLARNPPSMGQLEMGGFITGPITTGRASGVSHEDHREEEEEEEEEKDGEEEEEEEESEISMDKYEQHEMKETKVTGDVVGDIKSITKSNNSNSSILSSSGSGSLSSTNRTRSCHDVASE
ncbi:hypothetical protein EC973_002542 [Apophysomyces ossiformis]|uniref:Major facilitator superfamily (MFS) profile domain-containing protein n=1 Tax=Apophysomyces ossiformis TaxID=679940 RepID=A0A8H7BY80_9FUNG|nr:hypothetical protein EC973_002542 [Apophysomyces ossiformis]